MSKPDTADEQVTEDHDEELTFGLGPPVVPPPPAETALAPSVAPSAPAQAGGPVEVTAVVPMDLMDSSARKEPMKIVKLRVPASTHAQVISLMESLGCVSESQIYRQVLYVGLKHTKRSR